MKRSPEARMREDDSKLDRPETFSTIAETFESVEQPVGIFQKLWNNAYVRKAVLLIVLASAWELYARYLDAPRVFPTLLDRRAEIGTHPEPEELYGVLSAFISSRDLPRAALYTITLLLAGYGMGLILAVLLTAFASVNRIGADLLETLTSMFNPLPSIALLPLAIIWFQGENSVENSIVFVLVHAVVWSVALNTHAGFRAVSPTWRMVGRNYGLSPLGYIRRILIPGAFPSILTGLKTGWAFAWRTMIAAELVFGSSRGGGIGRFIDKESNFNHTSSVFAALLTVILFGLVVEHLIFRTIENRTVRRWGMEV
jgi:NitT/TauT family transport system permease protein